MKDSEEFAYEWLGTPWHFAHQRALAPTNELRHIGIWPS
jgi:hypothetical protein